MTSYDLSAFLRHVIKAGNDVSPTTYLGGMPDHEVPVDFRAFVQDLLDRGIVEGTMRPGWGATMPPRVAVTDFGRTHIAR